MIETLQETKFLPPTFLFSLPPSYLPSLPPSKQHSRKGKHVRFLIPEGQFPLWAAFTDHFFGSLQICQVVTSSVSSKLQSYLKTLRGERWVRSRWLGSRGRGTGKGGPCAGASEFPTRAGARVGVGRTGYLQMAVGVRSLLGPALGAGAREQSTPIHSPRVQGPNDQILPALRLDTHGWLEI